MFLLIIWKMKKISLYIKSSIILLLKEKFNVSILPALTFLQTKGAGQLTGDGGLEGAGKIDLQCEFIVYAKFS